jgi:NAD(P)-dependent dehydrogenase (short-subunit alcohol dehydrogenase family)
LGHVDVLVCSAGVAGLNAMTVDYPIEEWKKVPGNFATQSNRRNLDVGLKHLFRLGAAGRGNERGQHQSPTASTNAPERALR